MASSKHFQPVDLCVWEDFREELVRVAFRRERCNLITTANLCTGSCFWDASTSSCTLKTLEALLAVIDEDCPLRQA